MTKLHTYLVISIIGSLYQGFRGYRFQWVLGIEKIKGPFNRISLLCIAEAFTYFLCAATGFYALFFLYRKGSQVNELSPAIVIFLALYGIVGVTGKLPDLLGKLNFPGA